MRFMGKYSEPLATQFADLAGVRAGQQVLDVGCGPGALTAELVSRVGADAVSAVEPSASFAAATRERLPGVEVRLSPAEQLPFPDGAFDAAMAQLVVHFMADPVTGLREMGRVTRPGGVVAACVWDHAGDRGPLTAFWSAVRALDPAAPDESGLAGVREGHLAELFAQAGLDGTQASTLTVRVRQASFGQWWEPFTLGVGRPGHIWRRWPRIAAPPARALPGPATRRPVRGQRHRLGGGQSHLTPLVRSEPATALGRR